MNIVYEKQLQTKVNSAFKLPIEKYTLCNCSARMLNWVKEQNYESFKS